IAESAICFGVTGMAGCLPTVSPAPVMAQVTMTSVFITGLLWVPRKRLRSGSFRRVIAGCRIPTSLWLSTTMALSQRRHDAALRAAALVGRRLAGPGAVGAREMRRRGEAARHGDL